MLKALNAKEPKFLSYICENLTFFVKILKETVDKILWIGESFSHCEHGQWADKRTTMENSNNARPRVHQQCLSHV